jgi:hypothetical protein
MKSSLVILIVSVLTFAGTVRAEEDLRVYQHGIDIIEKKDGSLLLVWSSAGNPPIDDWIHDVYTSPLDRNNPTIVPSKLLGAGEAQEPASSAVNSEGNILVTMEDGFNAEHEVAQRYGVYSGSLVPVRPYPQILLDGGHSGHVASVGSNFVIFFSEGWVDGGGVDGLGSGDEVYASIVSSRGDVRETIPVAVGESRDWWPLVAGSPSRAGLVWQRFVPGETRATLMLAILNPASGVLTTRPTVLAQGITYYTYDIAYISNIKRFIVLASGADGGRAYLLNDAGVVTARLTGIPALVREGQPAIRDDGEGAMVVYPRSGGGVTILTATPDSLVHAGNSEGKHRWQYMGTTGVFLDTTHAFFASLSAQGVVTETFTVTGQEPAPATLSAPVTPTAIEEVFSIPTITERIHAQARATSSPIVPTTPSVCASVLPPGRLPYGYYVVHPYRVFTPTAHLLLSRYCLNLQQIGGVSQGT